MNRRRFFGLLGGIGAVVAAAKLPGAQPKEIGFEIDPAFIRALSRYRDPERITARDWQREFAYRGLNG